MSADERAIRRRSKRYEAATRANDPKGVCAMTAREVIDQIEAFGLDVRELRRRRHPRGRAALHAHDDLGRDHGDHAMTRGKAVESDGPRSGDQPLVRENGRWLLTTKAG